jgi:hypothetical protein
MGVVAGQHDITADFWIPAPGSPQRLAFLHAPARSGGSEQWGLARRAASGGQHQADEQR